MEAAIVGLISTFLGALISSFAGWMNNWHQYRMEGQKLADQQQKERREQLQEKLEEAHQLLSKIRTETTPQASYRMRSTEATLYPEQYQKSHEDVRRLLMITDLYFPQLREPVEALEGLTIHFWNEHQNVMSLEGAEDPGRFKNEWGNAVHELSEISREISPKVLEAKNKLREIATSLSVAGS